MDSKNKIDQLISCVSNCETKDYLKLLQDLNFTAGDFIEYINFSSEKYIRTCVAKGDDFELILLCWEKGQKAPIHGHDGSEGWAFVVQGEFEEKRYILNPNTNQLNQKFKVRMSDNEICHTSTDKSEFHSIANVNNGRSITLHLYKNPIEKCRVYDEKSGEMIQRNMQYDFKNEAVFI
jgi:cysteine dioxygenase